MDTQEIKDLGEERRARKKINLVIGNLYKWMESKDINEPLADKEIIQKTMNLACENNLTQELIDFAQIQHRNNIKYPRGKDKGETLDVLAKISDLIAEAGLQLKK